MKSRATQIRKRLNWTQTQLAQYLGVDQSTVSRIERGGAMSKPIEKLLDLLEMTQGRVAS